MIPKDEAVGLKVATVPVMPQHVTLEQHSRFFKGASTVLLWLAIASITGAVVDIVIKHI